MNRPTNNQVITGFPKSLIILAMYLTIIWRAFYVLKYPWKVVTALRRLLEIRKHYLGTERITRLVRSGNTYFWDMYGPGWPSKIYNRHMDSEISKVMSIDKNQSLRNVMMAVTKKCPLQCEHCYEWDALNQPEELSLSQLQFILDRFLDYGTAQVIFGGGEPMMRYQDVLRLLETGINKADFWMVTAGIGVTPRKARELKKFGLTGVCVSLDHFDSEKHNHFRNFKNSFSQAQQAVTNSIEAGLVVALSVCCTRSFISEENVWKYLEMAREWNVNFVQFLEPKSAGHYANQDVNLFDEQKKQLKMIFKEVNHNKKYADYPIIIYHEQYYDQLGCFGAGDRFLYVDTDGYINACPFCRSSQGHAIHDDLSQTINGLKKNGCTGRKHFEPANKILETTP